MGFFSVTVGVKCFCPPAGTCACKRPDKRSASVRGTSFKVGADLSFCTVWLVAEGGSGGKPIHNPARFLVRAKAKGGPFFGPGSIFLVDLEQGLAA